MRGQAVDLRDVEHGVGLEERSLALDVVAVRIGFLLGEAVGEDDMAPCSALRTCASSASACLNVIQSGDGPDPAIARLHGVYTRNMGTPEFPPKCPF